MNGPDGHGTPIASSSILGGVGTGRVVLMACKRSADDFDEPALKRPRLASIKGLLSLYPLSETEVVAHIGGHLSLLSADGASTTISQTCHAVCVVAGQLVITDHDGTISVWPADSDPAAIQLALSVTPTSVAITKFADHVYAFWFLDAGVITCNLMSQGCLVHTASAHGFETAVLVSPVAQRGDSVLVTHSGDLSPTQLSIAIDSVYLLTVPRMDLPHVARFGTNSMLVRGNRRLLLTSDTISHFVQYPTSTGSAMLMSMSGEVLSTDV